MMKNYVGKRFPDKRFWTGCVYNVSSRTGGGRFERRSGRSRLGLAQSIVTNQGMCVVEKVRCVEEGDVQTARRQSKQASTGSFTFRGSSMGIFGKTKQTERKINRSRQVIVEESVDWDECFQEGQKRDRQRHIEKRCCDIEQRVTWSEEDVVYLRGGGRAGLVIKGWRCCTLEDLARSVLMVGEVKKCDVMPRTATTELGTSRR